VEGSSMSFSLSETYLIKYKYRITNSVFIFYKGTESLESCVTLIRYSSNKKGIFGGMVINFNAFYKIFSSLNVLDISDILEVAKFIQISVLNGWINLILQIY
jgi:hypothetical protein